MVAVRLASAWDKFERAAVVRLFAWGERRRSKPKPRHLLVGERGELEALFFLRAQGFQVVDRRWLAAELRGDIDLVAWEGDVLCIVEVKTRTARDETPARAAVDGSKQRMLGRMGRAYRRTLPREWRRELVMRFDVVSVYLLAEEVECELLRGVFDADGGDFAGDGV